MVETCNKDHGLLGIEVLKVDTTKLINSIKAEKNNIGLLKGYRDSIHLKENHNPSYLESRKLPIHVLLMAKLKKKKKKKKQRIQEKVPQGVSNSASLFVAIRKLDEDFRICRDYKRGMNHSFLLPNIETMSQEIFCKNRSQVCIQPNKNWWEIQGNYHCKPPLWISLLRWTHLPLGIRTLCQIFKNLTEKKFYHERFKNTIIS